MKTLLNQGNVTFCQLYWHFDKLPKGKRFCDNDKQNKCVSNIMLGSRYIDAFCQVSLNWQQELESRSTVKSVYNDYLGDKVSMVVIDRWSL